MAETNQGGNEAVDTITAASDQPQQQVQLQIDDSDMPVGYSTTVRVSGTAEEINLDFAGPIRPTDKPRVARLKIQQRIILNPWAAKRLAIALAQAVARYEQTYGTLELDERKRRINPPTAGGPAADNESTENG